MNARLYDPALGRFLSPDPYVQAPDFSQSFNRYSYCLNNPLRYVDKNGEFISSTIITGILGLVEAVGRTIGAWFVGFDDPGKAGKMFENAWKDYGKQMGNAWKIDMGLFKTDPNKSFGGRAWELISRFTWQKPQTVVGNLIMTGGNVAYQVNNVTYGYGVTSVDMGLEDGNAITVGSNPVESRLVWLFVEVSKLRFLLIGTSCAKGSLQTSILKNNMESKVFLLTET